MRIALRFLLTALLSMVATPAAFATNVVINEIMYFPASGNLHESYIELYNADTATADLSGWAFANGLQFSFPTNTLLAPGAYLVVAADASAFTAKYPGVTNFLAGWVPPMGAHVVLADGAGNVASEVHYSNDGDWAVRYLSAPMYAHQSWEWSAPYDGVGASLELINSSLPNSYALNWGPSSVTGGTPGRANSIAQSNVAPFVTSVAHSPVVPHPTDVVTVSARITDEHTNGVVATLYYRNATTASPPAFTAVPMFDDGAHNDALASDGIYAAILPAQSAGTVIEFYLQVSDLEGHLRTYPNFLPPTNSLRTANLLYQVDTGAYTGSQPLYRIIMTEMERAEIYAIGRQCPDSDSDAQMNATWITTDGVVTGGTTTQVRYNAGIRNRGHGSRQANPNNYHVNIPGDRAWKNLTGINLNSQYAYSQVLGSAVFRRLEVPMAESRVVQVRINSTNLMSLPGLPDNNSFGCYAANEQYNNDFVQRAFAHDPLGNSYRGIRDSVLCDTSLNGVADLTWQGANYVVAAYTNAYFKQNNFLTNDWSDLIDLIAILNSANGYQAANYVADVQRRINVDEWMQYMAINTLLDNDETCLANGTGDDYALYRGTLDTRFLALSYDMDTVMGRGLTPVPPRHSLFRMNALAAMSRFMQTPAFAPSYYRWLKTYADTAFSPAQMNPLLDQLLNSFVPQGTIDTMKAFNAAQVSYVLSQIPLALAVSNSLTVQSGYPRTTTSFVTLTGTANVIDTRSVLVNGSPAIWVAWQGTWTAANAPLTPGINRLLVQSLDTNGVVFAQTNVDVWYDKGSVTTAGGTITANTTWTAAGGPYSVTSSLTVASGATLTIQPGTCVYLGTSLNLVVANGGQLLAEGTAAAPIRFTVAPGSGFFWGNLTINGALGSPESRITYAIFDFNANDTGTPCIEVDTGTAYLDHLTFGQTGAPYIHVDGASFTISDCYFPTPTAQFEPCHGTRGVRSDGHGLFLRNFFGKLTGYNDVVDFTGGNRPHPIVHFIGNVVMGGDDDGFDIDGTDAWVEGNIFLHLHRNNGTPDSSSAVSGGNYSYSAGDPGGTGTETSEITIIGNLIYDCDQAIDAKQGNFFTLFNNTIVHQTHIGGIDPTGAVVILADTGTAEGAGTYLEGNIVYDAENLTRNVTAALVTYTNNILCQVQGAPWTGPGGNNSISDPLLKRVPQVSETYFTNWASAQVLWDWFSLQSGSPARGTGPNGRDQGGVIPIGASVAGEPPATNNQTTATLTVGIVRTGNGIPVSGWPSGSGYIDYKWRFDSGNWSAPTPTTTPITLSGLTNGPHHVEVTGLRDSGWYQDDPVFGPDALVTTSRTWTVNTSYVPPALPTIRLNEILALNSTTLTNAGTTPDLIELYNCGSVPVDLSGMGLTDNATSPYKYTFPVGTPLLGPGQFLVLYADNATSAPGTHLGFNLNASGEAVYLHDKSASGAALLDSIDFGVQIPDLSLGRGADGTWVLCSPTFGANNVAVPLADPDNLKINEWLASELFLAKNDFIELYNPATRPIALGGLYLSNAEGAPGLDQIPALSFIAANGYVSFTEDGNTAQGADHLNFKLDAEVGIIILSDPALTTIDAVNYGPQQTDVAQGRSPSGSDTLVSFSQPTPGSPNPTSNGTITVTNVTTLTVPLLMITNSWKYDNSGGTNFGATWLQIGYNDSAWSSGTGLFGYETTPSEYPYPFNTYVPPPDTNGGKITVYYRTHFQWNAGLTNVTLFSTNYVDDGAVYYLNGTQVGSLRMTAPVSYNTLAGNQPNEGVAEVLSFATDSLVTGDNVMAVEVHQTGTTSSDDVFGMLLSAVQSSTNIIAMSVGVPVVLNEVLASNRSVTNFAGITSDWIELFNSATNSVDLADLSLSDDLNTPRKFVFAPGTMLPSGGFFLLYCNNNLPGSPTNTGFSLNATGGSLFLFNSPTNGGGLIDSLTYGLQTPDVSIGRIPNGSGVWSLTVPSPAAPNTAAGLGDASSLTVNEWMADPMAGSDWFELFNSGTQPVSLGGLFFTSDLTRKTLSPIPPLSFIGTGGNGFVQFFADSQPGAGPDHVNFKLGKSGDSVGLFSPDGSLITAVTFGAQRTGVSQGHFPDGSTNLVSFTTTVSPGQSNFLPLSNVVVNEVLTHTGPPLEDAIEFYNPTAAAVDLSGWFVSNSQNDLKKYRMADGTVLPAHGFTALYEYQFNPTNGSAIPFTFNSAHGGEAWLSQADASGNLTGYRAFATFGAAANGVSFGRYTNSIGEVDFVAMSVRTFGVDNPSTVEDFRAGAGAPNAYPFVGPIIINELMFDPPSQDGITDNIQDEYVELLNFSANNVPLFDPAAPTNTWAISGGIAYTFPQNVNLPAGSSLLLVNFDPVIDQPALAEFLGRYQLTNAASLFGPYSGHLANSGETIALYKPDSPQLPPHPDAGYVPYVLVDQISYSAASPWPTNASGTGSSLQRLVAANYGNDPANWFVAAPTPAQPNTSNPLDTNGDGLPDAWQIHYFGSINSPDARPDADPDHDGMNNLQEYLAGTDPTDPNSVFKLSAVTQVAPGVLQLQWLSATNRLYTVLESTSITASMAAFNPLATNILATPPVNTCLVTNASPQAAHFYRLQVQ
jgi:hypothetical protein